MLNVDTSHPDIYGEFLNGNFQVQQSLTYTFGKIWNDKAIKTVIKQRYQKQRFVLYECNDSI